MKTIDRTVDGITVQVSETENDGAPEFHVYCVDPAGNRTLTLTTRGPLYMNPSDGQIRRMLEPDNVALAQQRAY